MGTDKITVSIVFGVAWLLASMPAIAATFNVTRFDDPVPTSCTVNRCSLREAVIAANATTAEDVIQLGAGVYQLTQSGAGVDQLNYDLDVTQPLRIIGHGADTTIIRNEILITNEQTRVIEVTQTSLVLSRLALQEGNVYSPIVPIFTAPVKGGCLNAEHATVTLERVVVSNCLIDAIGSFGAGIALEQSQAHLSEVDIHSNNAVASAGGGLAVINSQVELNRVGISHNNAGLGGGMISAAISVINATALSIIENDAQSGGGIYISAGMYAYLPNATDLNVSTDSLIARNEATQYGGGIYTSLQSTLRIASIVDASIGLDDLLRIEENHANADGGGIYISPSYASISGTVPGSHLEAHRLAVRANTTGGDGGGMYAGGSAAVHDSEFAFNSAVGDGGGVKISGEIADNLIERSSIVGNVAGGNGGAILNAADDTQLRNVSSYANTANHGGGVYNTGGASAKLVHFTSLDDAAVVGGSLYAAAFGGVELQNSVLAAGCHKQSISPFVSGYIVDAAGNAQRKGQPACAGTAYTDSRLALHYDYFGGRFNVVGFDSGSSLRNKLPLLLEASDDVRGWNRVAPADIGAFEFDTVGN